jgi:hypothetical protein
MLAGAGCAAPPPGPDAVATWAGGAVTLAQVESVLRSGSISVPQGERTELVAAYRQAAERLVIERTVEERVAAAGAAVADDDPALLRATREVVLDLYHDRLRAELPSIEPGDVEGFHATHEDDFRRRPRSYVLHIFRRHQDPERPQATMTLLDDLRRRALAGESFEQLARDHSQSETRLVGGRLGWIAPGKLPPRLEEIVFALDKGEISDPVPVPGGATIFQVSEAIRERQIPLDDARPLIRDHLTREALRERVEAEIGDLQPPPDALILEAETIAPFLRRAAADDVLLHIADYRVTAGEFLELYEDWGARLPGLPFLEAAPDALYGQLVLDQLLYLHAGSTGFAEDSEVARAVALRLDALRRELTVQRWFEATMGEGIGEADLERFFDANRYLYQSPVRFRLRSLTVLARPDAATQIAELEALRDALDAGAVTFDQAATRVGGELGDLGWMTVSGLLRLEPKVAAYILGLEGVGYSVPFQLNRRLNIVAVEERQEPQPLAYDEVADRVREDYIARHQQRLYQEVLDRLLADTAFHFHEDAVLAALE